MIEAKRKAVAKVACPHCGAPKLFACYSELLQRAMVNQIHEQRRALAGVTQ